MLSWLGPFVVFQTKERRNYETKKRTEKEIRARILQSPEHYEEGNEERNIEQTSTPPNRVYVSKNGKTQVNMPPNSKMKICHQYCGTVAIMPMY